MIQPLPLKGFPDQVNEAG